MKNTNFMGHFEDVRGGKVRAITTKEVTRAYDNIMESFSENSNFGIEQVSKVCAFMTNKDQGGKNRIPKNFPADDSYVCECYMKIILGYEDPSAEDKEMLNTACKEILAFLVEYDRHRNDNKLKVAKFLFLKEALILYKNIPDYVRLLVTSAPTHRKAETVRKKELEKISATLTKEEYAGVSNQSLVVRSIWLYLMHPEYELVLETTLEQNMHYRTETGMARLVKPLPLYESEKISREVIDFKNLLDGRIFVLLLAIVTINKAVAWTIGAERMSEIFPWVGEPEWADFMQGATKDLLVSICYVYFERYCYEHKAELNAYYKTN